MAEQPFKCSIKFPEDSSPNEEEDEKNSFEIIHKSEAEDLTPVIVLLGWGGCQEKHLSKYSVIYEKKGFITVKVIVPQQMLYFQSNKIIQVAKGLLDILAQNNLVRNPVIIHLFSNGGCMVYSQLTTLLNSPESQYHEKLLVRGVILDSAPGKRRILNAVKAFMSMLQFGVVFRYILGLCLLLYLFFTRILQRLLPFDVGSKTGFQLYDTICADPARCPQLFLYSRADKVVLAEDVEEVMAAREQRGVSVKSVCWDDSQHVAHFRAHPEVYTQSCFDFVAACLTTNPSKL